MTKSYKKKYIICNVLSSFLTLLPMLIYAVIAFTKGTNVEKFCLATTLLVSIMLVALNVVFKRHIRSTIWILLLGIHICMNNITTLLIIIAITTILDEFIFEPMSKKYKQKYIINKEIDKRNE